jgi:hypothetical protein
MPWPPQVGELLPRCDEPEGIKERLRDYSLEADHERGGPKAKGFRVILGVDSASIDYLDERIGDGINSTAIALVEPREASAAFCLVVFRIAGPERYSHRTAWLRTGWIFSGPAERPRLVTAYLRPEGRR